MALKSNQIGVAIIGYGRFAENYLKNLVSKDFAKRVSVKYLCKRNPIIVNDTVEKSIKLYKTKVATDYKKVIDDPKVDLVIVTSSPESHFEICKYALEKNKHIICEKPLVFSVLEVQTLIALHEKLKNKIFVVNYIHLFNENWALFKKQFFEMNMDMGIFRFGNQGPVTNISPLWDYGVHDVAMTIDLMLSVPNTILTDMSIVSAIKEQYDQNCLKSNYYSMQLSYKNEDKRYVFGIAGGNTLERRVRECWGTDKSVSKFGTGEHVNVLQWSDDKTFNSLANMLKICIENINKKREFNNWLITANTTVVLEKLYDVLRATQLKVVHE